MRNILFICALIASTAISAQSLDAKKGAKELKAKQKIELAKFKAKQKEDLALFLECQKAALSNKKSNPFKFPQMVTEGDSVSYIFGVGQTNGLKNFITMQQKVDTTKMEAFCRGMMATLNGRKIDESEHAFNVGLNIGEDIIRMSKSIQSDYFENDSTDKIVPLLIAKGLTDGIFGLNTKSIDECGQLFNEKLEQRKNAVYEQNRLFGEKFLAENKTKSGVVTLPSGLQYKVLKQGNGQIPTKNDKIKVNYEGRLVDGTIFDSSYARNEPTVFEPQHVISGFAEALTMMPVGSTWELYIPQELGYGAQESGIIKPYSATIFKIEVISIEK